MKTMHKSYIKMRFCRQPAAGENFLGCVGHSPINPPLVIPGLRTRGGVNSRMTDLEDKFQPPQAENLSYFASVIVISLRKIAFLDCKIAKIFRLRRAFCLFRSK